MLAQVTPQHLETIVFDPRVGRRRSMRVRRSRSIGRSCGTNSKTISGQLGHLRARESEILNQAAFEEGGWRELSARMEEWMKR